MTHRGATVPEFDSYLSLRRDQIDHEEDLVLDAIDDQKTHRGRAQESVRSGLTTLLVRPELWRRIPGGSRIPDHSTPKKRAMWREVRKRGTLLIDLETERFERKLLPPEDR